MGRSIMVVGNGGIPVGMAETIDAADVVIRFNECRSFGAGGSRTDIVAVCNTGRPARQMMGSQTWRESRAVGDCAQIWSVRDPAKFHELRDVLAESHPELDDFCDDMSRDFEAFALERGKGHYIVPREIHEVVDAALAAHDAGDYIVPSSGLIVIADLLHNPAFSGDSITIAGFGHQGWEGHPFAAEKRLVDSYAAAGQITRLHQPSALSQGA